MAERVEAVLARRDRSATERMEREIARAELAVNKKKAAAQSRKAVVSEVVCGGKRYQFSASGKCVGVAE